MTKKIGSWWTYSFEAKDNELILFSCLANYAQSPNRALGGKLFLTNKRLLFCPHYIDYFIKGNPLEILNSEIKSVGVKKKGGDLYSGGLRDRLMITLKNSDHQLFVVNQLNKKVELIKKILFL